MRRVAQILGECHSLTAAFSVAGVLATAIAEPETPETLTGDGEDGPRCSRCQRLLPPGTPDGELCTWCERGIA